MMSYSAIHGGIFSWLEPPPADDTLTLWLWLSDEMDKLWLCVPLEPDVAESLKPLVFRTLFDPELNATEK